MPNCPATGGVPTHRSTGVGWKPGTCGFKSCRPRQCAIIAGMTNLQLALSIGIPSLLILVGIFLNNARFNSIETRLTTMEGDLRQFYRDLGRHEADITNIKEKQS